MADAELQILIRARNQAKAEFDSLSKQVNQLQGNKGVGGLTSKMKGLDAGFQKLTGVSLGAAGAIGIASMAVKKMWEYSQVAIEAASDLAETETKTNIVFGEGADIVQEWGEQAAESLGMSKNAALASAAEFGNLFRAMNMSEKQSANMSTALVQLAGDLASFNNMDPEEVFIKLRSGITGEFMPLKTLGVNINEVILKQRALEMGLWDGVGALDAQAKALASYDLIMEQTSLAQGDFDRTSEGLANQQRILKANTEDLAAVIGEYLLPAKLAMVESNNLLITQTIDYVTALQNEKEQVERLGLVYDQHLGYIKDGVLLTGEQVNEMKAADRANQAWTASLEAQADAYFELHPQIQDAIVDYSDLETAIDDVNVLMKDYTAELLFNQAAAGLDSEASIMLAEKMGLIDEETSGAMDRLAGFRKMLADGKITVAEYTSLVSGLDRSIRGIPDKTIHLRIRGDIDNDARIAMNMSGQGANPYIGLTTSNRAVGGPVSANTPYIVGEVGPELFVPNSSGSIVPNNQLSGGGAVVNFYYSPAISLSDRTEAEMRLVPIIRKALAST